MKRAGSFDDLNRILAWAENQPELREFFSVGKPEWIEAGYALMTRAENNAGDDTGIPHFDQVMRFRPAETTLWIGANGGGKSQAIGQFTARWALRGRHCVVLSLEMSPPRQLMRLARLVTGLRNPSRPVFEHAIAALDENYTIVNLAGRVQSRMALAIIAYAAKELGAAHVVIDNLTMLLSVDNDSANEVQEFVGHAVRVTALYGCHTHLIAHIKKPQDKRHVPDRYDARGTGSAPDQVDNVVSVWRNESKEDARAEGRSDLNHEPDAMFFIDKQRETGERAKISADHTGGAGQFVAPGAGPFAMIDLVTG